MTTQTQTTSADLHEFILALPIAETLQADSRDYGFDFDQDELGRELLAPLPASLAVRSFPEVDAFENTSHYFIS